MYQRIMRALGESKVGIVWGFLNSLVAVSHLSGSVIAATTYLPIRVILRCFKVIGRGLMSLSAAAAVTPTRGRLRVFICTFQYEITWLLGDVVRGDGVIGEG
ncbi:hypothetical protein F4678DRAFT_449191 [Xylaria arbuscula]|nr:hypothetical protein F4678DRAFT_449191 [Xylaria arbuscula]